MTIANSESACDTGTAVGNSAEIGAFTVAFIFAATRYTKRTESEAVFCAINEIATRRGKYF